MAAERGSGLMARGKEALTEDMSESEKKSE
jgi:hypothetical protein